MRERNAHDKSLVVSAKALESLVTRKDAAAQAWMDAKSKNEEARQALDVAKSALKKHEADLPKSTTPVEGADRTTTTKTREGAAARTAPSTVEGAAARTAPSTVEGAAARTAPGTVEGAAGRTAPRFVPFVWGADRATTTKTREGAAETTPKTEAKA